MGIIGADRKLRVEVPECLWMPPDGLSLTQRHPVRVLRAAEPIWGVHSQHQAAAQGTGLWVSAGFLLLFRGMVFAVLPACWGRVSLPNITSGKLEKICKYP